MRLALDEAWTALQDGDPAGAACAFAELTRTRPSAAEAWLGLAHAHRSAGDWPASIEALQGLVAHATDRDLVREAALARAQALDAELGDLVAARKAYEGALVLDPDQVWPYLALAELDLRAGVWNRALAYASHGLEGAGPLAPERPWLLLCRAVGRQRSSLSMGPVSSFFRRLGDEVVEPGRGDLELALRALPRLGALLPADPLADVTVLARVIRSEMPRPRFPSPR